MSTFSRDPHDPAAHESDCPRAGDDPAGMPCTCDAEGDSAESAATCGHPSHGSADHDCAPFRVCCPGGWAAGHAYWCVERPAVNPSNTPTPDAQAESWPDLLRLAADALEAQPPKLRTQYVAALRLYADEPWRITANYDPRTHGDNHAPLRDGDRLEPGFCRGCDRPSPPGATS